MSRHQQQQQQQLKEIWEQLQDFSRENQSEIADLEYRLERAKQKRESLLARVEAAKANYEASTSTSASASNKHVVDLLDDDDDDDDDGRESTPNSYARSPGTSNEKGAKDRSAPRWESPGARRQARRRASSCEENRRLKPPPLGHREVLDVFGCCSSDDEDRTQTRNAPKNGAEKRTTPDRVGARGDRASNAPATHGNQRPRAPPSNTGAGDERKTAAGPQSDARTTGLGTTRSQPAPAWSTGSNGSPNERPVLSQQTPSGTNGGETPRAAESGARSLPKRTRKRKSADTVRILYRPRPEDVPPERWLNSSIGRTREELNSIRDMVQYMGSCKFGQSSVCSKFGRVHAIVMSDEWNDLAQRNDVLQNWYVGLGPGRKRLARLVGACESTIPIFQAPKKEHRTPEIFYVGHYKVLGLQELDPTVTIKGIERDIKLSFAFDRFDGRLDAIIQGGPVRSGSTPGQWQR